eukprot:5357975-Prymnesium_polylepis.2
MNLRAYADRFKGEYLIIDSRRQEGGCTAALGAAVSDDPRRCTRRPFFRRRSVAADLSPCHPAGL